MPQNAGPSIQLLAALDASLSAARAEFPPLVKTKSNPHFKSRYCPLDAIFDAVIPVLSRHGLSLSSGYVMTQAGCVLLTTLSHVGGGWRSSTFPILNLEPQKAGSAATYAQRYSVTALLGVAAEEDDDGNFAQAQVQGRPMGNGAGPGFSSPAPMGAPQQSGALW